MTALASLSILLYLLASWRLGRDPAAGLGLGLLLGVNAILTHLGFHAGLAWRDGELPLHFFSALSWVSLGMAALSSAIAFSRRFDALGRAVYPLGALCLAGALLFPAPPSPPLSWPLRLHALLALLAYATLAIAAVLAVLLAIQEKLLRQRRLDHPVLRALPPLTELELLMFRSVGAGFLLLTLALIIGAVFVEDLFAQHLVHKTVLSLLSWTVFGVLLLGRIRFGWRGRRAIRLTLTAMTLLLLGFFGSRFVLELLLGRAT